MSAAEQPGPVGTLHPSVRLGRDIWLLLSEWLWKDTVVASFY